MRARRRRGTKASIERRLREMTPAGREVVRQDLKAPTFAMLHDSFEGADSSADLASWIAAEGKVRQVCNQRDW